MLDEDDGGACRERVVKEGVSVNVSTTQRGEACARGDGAGVVGQRADDGVWIADETSIGKCGNEFVNTDVVRHAEVLRFPRHVAVGCELATRTKDTSGEAGKYRHIVALQRLRVGDDLAPEPRLELIETAPVIATGGSDAVTLGDGR